MHIGPVTLADRAAVNELVREASLAVGDHKFSHHFLFTEWDQVADAWQLESWDAYRDVARLGRKTRLPEVQRRILWSIFEKVRSVLSGRDFITEATLFARLADYFSAGRKRPV